MAAQKKKRNEDPIELHLLLGKAFRDEQLTEELCWRIWGFFDYQYFKHQPRAGHEQIAVVSGGGGEAAVMQAWIFHLQSSIFQRRTHGVVGPFGRGMKLLETASPNSLLNIAFSVSKVRAAGFHGPICLYLYTSPYHCDALLELRYKLWKVSPFSFVQLNSILDVVARPTPYLYPNCGIRELEWLADAYLIRQGLRLAWENLRGISGIIGGEELRLTRAQRRERGLLIRPGTVDTLLPESVQRMELALKRFRALRDDLFTPDECFVARIRAAREHIDCFLSGIEKHMCWLRNRVGPIQKTQGWSAEWREHAKALEPFINPSHVKDIDPDMAGISWEAVQHLATQQEEAAPVLSIVSEEKAG